MITNFDLAHAAYMTSSSGTRLSESPDCQWLDLGRRSVAIGVEDELDDSGHQWVSWAGYIDDVCETGPQCAVIEYAGDIDAMAGAIADWLER